jgi:transcriptional regulator with XRE-family HTH domain
MTNESKPRKTTDTLNFQKEIGERLKQEVTRIWVRGAAEKFAEFIGKNPSTVYSWFKGDQMVDAEALAQLHTQYEVSPTWILTGGIDKPRYNNPDSQRAALWQRRNPEKARAARFALSNPKAVTVLYECPHEDPKENHHPYYEDSPLEILRLCRLCHSSWHKRLRDISTPKGTIIDTRV